MGNTPLPYTTPNQFDPLYNWEEDRDDGIDIMADRHRANDVDAAAAISLALKRDGTSTITQNIPMSGKRFTGLGEGVDPTDSVTKGYVDDNLSISNIGDYLTTERVPSASWLKRDGATYSKASYPALATLLGDRYGKLAGFTLGAFGVTTNISAGAYGAGLFVMGGTGGMIRTSPTGTTWTARTSGISQDISRIIFANNQFVACSYGGKIITSPDGITWTSRTSGVVTDLLGITYGNSKYVICGASGVILVSPDNGVNWIVKSIGGYTETLSAATYGNGRYVLVGGAAGGAGGASVTSVDGDTFAMTRTGYGGAHTDVTFGRGVFVAEGGTAAYVSPSGVGAWSAYGIPGTIFRVQYGINNFIGVGSNFTASSIDGKTWDTHTAITGIFFAVAIGPSYAWAGGTTGVIAKSDFAYDTVTQFMVPGDNPDNGYIKAL